MCGRYTLYHDEEDFTSLFEVEAFPLTPRYNVAPTQQVSWVRQRPSGAREVMTGRWGFVPRWVKDPAAFRASLINARAETAAEKPSFRDALRHARCAIPASGFYEWRREGVRKQPYHVIRSDGAPLLLAGLYAERPVDSGGPSAAILTCAANERIAELHDRMPVVLDALQLACWLDAKLDRPDEIEQLLGPCPNDVLDAYPVHPRVGNARIDDAGLVQAIHV